jgi:hypothetical protein
MAKNCTICSSTPEVQEQILQLHKNGKSYREIETSLTDEFKLNISNSSIRRHLVNCIKAKKDDKPKITLNFNEMHTYNQPDGADMHKALCYILRYGIEMFFQRMGETIDAKTPYNVHLETYKCLDILIKMLGNLYPNSAELAKEKEQEKYTNRLKNMKGIKLDILMKLFTNDKEMPPSRA